MLFTISKSENFVKFFLLMFPNLQPNEAVAVQYMIKDGVFSKPIHAYSAEDVMDFVESHPHKDVYISVATINTDKVNNDNKRTDYVLKSASVIVLDFDFKNGNIKPKVKEFVDDLKSKCDLFFAAVVDSGHGYHIYIPIQKTTNLKSWNKVTRELCKIYKADFAATKKTQLVRIPNSLNFKSDSALACNLVCVTDKYRRYSLSQLQEAVERCKRRSDPNATYTGPDLKPCVKKMLKGVPTGHRNTCLGRIVSNLKLLNYDKDDALNIALEFNANCSEPKSERIIIDDFEMYWNTDYNLNGCHPTEPRSYQILQSYCDPNCTRSNSGSILKFEPSGDEEEVTVDINKKALGDKLKLGTSELAVYIILAEKQSIKKGDLYSSMGISESIVRAAIKKLESEKLIEINGQYIYYLPPIKKKTTISVPVRAVELYLYGEISKTALSVYFAILMCSKKNISPSLGRLSGMLGIGKSYVSKQVNMLEEHHLIGRFYSNSNHSYQLKVA